MRTIPLFWWHRKNNLGDILNPHIVRGLTGNRVIRAGINSEKPYYMAAGSILNLANSNAIVWGSGLISEDRLYRSKPKKIYAVRGPLTRNKLLRAGCDCPAVYGDPALLLPRIHPSKVKKRYDLGIIPHYIDANHPWVENAKSDCHYIIDVINGDPMQVVDQILRCKAIASSSLHGLIIADAYGIPNVRIQFSDLLMGGNFKFKDYYMSVHKPRKCLDFRSTSQPDIRLIHDWLNGKKIDIDLDRLVEVCPMF